MERKKLASGVHLTNFKADKFKRCRVALHLIWPSERQTATAQALLPFLMERGHALCPDFTQLSKELAKLYGASLSVDISTFGANKILSIAVSGIKDIYALENEKLSEQYAQTALNVAFNPHFVNGQFDENNVAIEKEQLKELLQSEINDKRAYCVRQARRKFYGNAPEGIERNGYLEEVDSLTPQIVTQAWIDVIKSANIEVIVLGANANDVENSVIKALEKIDRNVKEVAPANAMQKCETQNYEEPVNTVQGKLCLIYTMQKSISGYDAIVLRIACALLGGTATSRLFVNVREKRSLCYYCAAYADARNGTLFIDSGIDHDKAKDAKSAIIEEFESLCKGPVTQKELDDTKRYVCDRLKSMEDLLDGVEGWYFSQILRQENMTPEEMIQKIMQVTAQQVTDILSEFSLSTSYLITKGEENE